MMMRTLTSILLIAAASATPAIVWKNSIKNAPSAVHSSIEVTSDVFLADTLTPGAIAPVHSVVFLLGRGQGGSENLSSLSSQGLLPKVADKQIIANHVYHHVSGIKSAAGLASEATRLGYQSRVVNLDDFLSTLSHMTGASEVEITENQLLKPVVWIVDIDASADPKVIDTAVVTAIANTSIHMVVLSAVRSLEEVRQERLVQESRRLGIMEQAGSGLKSLASRRRLEEAAGDDAANQAQNNEIDLSGIYYVSLTPNILAGLLFFVLFSVITYIGVGCMAMISGQDVFVSKMPAIGREA